MEPLSIVAGLSVLVLGAVSWMHVRSLDKSEQRIVEAMANVTESMRSMHLDSVEYMKASTLKEKVDSDTARQEAQVHIEQLTDAYYEEKQKQEKLIGELEARVSGGEMVELVDGRTVDLGRLEPII